MQAQGVGEELKDYCAQTERQQARPGEKAARYKRLLQHLEKPKHSPRHDM
jgi:hypothetical protein